MTIRQTVLLLGVSLGIIGGLASAADTPILLSGKAVKWGPPPPSLPPGAKFAVLEGDPAKTGSVTVRLKLPPGYKVPPHFHPTDEHVTVLSGDFSIGMGDAIDKAHAQHLTAGGYGAVPAQMHHWAYTTMGATIQIHLQGPFGITYVNPADDPSKKTAAR